MEEIDDGLLHDIETDPNANDDEKSSIIINSADVDPASQDLLKESANERNTGLPQTLKTLEKLIFVDPEDKGKIKVELSSSDDDEVENYKKSEHEKVFGSFNDKNCKSREKENQKYENLLPNFEKRKRKRDVFKEPRIEPNVLKKNRALLAMCKPLLVVLNDMRPLLTKTNSIKSDSFSELSSLISDSNNSEDNEPLSSVKKSKSTPQTFIKNDYADHVKPKNKVKQNNETKMTLSDLLVKPSVPPPVPELLLPAPFGTPAVVVPYVVNNNVIPGGLLLVGMPNSHEEAASSGDQTFVYSVASRWPPLSAPTSSFDSNPPVPLPNKLSTQQREKISKLSVQPVDICSLTPENSIDPDPNVVNRILSRFTNLRLKVRNHKICTELDIPPKSLSLAELKVLSKILSYAEQALASVRQTYTPLLHGDILQNSVRIVLDEIRKNELLIRQGLIYTCTERTQSIAVTNPIATTEAAPKQTPPENLKVTPNQAQTINEIVYSTAITQTEIQIMTPSEKRVLLKTFSAQNHRSKISSMTSLLKKTNKNDNNQSIGLPKIDTVFSLVYKPDLNSENEINSIQDNPESQKGAIIQMSNKIDPSSTKVNSTNTQLNVLVDDNIESAVGRKTGGQVSINRHDSQNVVPTTSKAARK